MNLFSYETGNIKMLKYVFLMWQKNTKWCVLFMQAMVTNSVVIRNVLCEYTIHEVVRDFNTLPFTI